MTVKETLQLFMAPHAARGIVLDADIQDLPPDALVEAQNIDLDFPRGSVARRQGSVRYSSASSPMGNTSYNHTATVMRLFWWRRRSGTRLLVAVVKTSTPTNWAAETVTTLGTFVSPTTANGYSYECTARAGDYKTGATEPTWGTTLGGTTDDDTNVTWTCRSDTLARLYYNNPYSNRTFSEASGGPFVYGTNYPALTVLNDRLFIAMGAADYKSNVVFNGTALNTHAGLDAPTTISTTTAIAGTTVEAGDHIYVYTFYDVTTDAESLPSPADTHTVAAGANQAVRISACDALPTGADRYRVYRTRAGGEVYQLLVETATDLNASNYDDVTSDNDLGYGMPPEYGGAPFSTKFCTAHNHRVLWAHKTDTTGTTEPNLVFPSEAGHPLCVDPLNGVAVRRDDGDEITGLATIFEQVYVFKRRHVYELIEDTSLIYRAEPVLADGPVGTISPGTIVSVEGRVIFLSEKGIMSCTGRQIETLVRDPGASRRTPLPSKITFSYTNRTGGSDTTNFQVSARVPGAIGATEMSTLAATAWAAGAPYSEPDLVRPTTYNGFRYECTTAGTSGGSEPTNWPTNSGDTVNDGSVTWTCEDSYMRYWSVGGRPFTVGGEVLADGDTITVTFDPFARTDVDQSLFPYITTPEWDLLIYAYGAGAVWTERDRWMWGRYYAPPDDVPTEVVQDVPGMFDFAINWSLADQFFAIDNWPRHEYQCFVAVNDSPYIDACIRYNYQTNTLVRDTTFASAGCMSDSLTVAHEAHEKPHPMVGDYDGVVWALNAETDTERDLEEMPTVYSDTSATLTYASGVWTLTDSGASFPTAGTNVTGLRGTQVVVTDGDGFNYTGIITGNTGTALTIRNWLWGRAPALGSLNYAVGALDSYILTPWYDLGDPNHIKQVKQTLVFCETRGADLDIELRFSQSPDEQNIANWRTWHKWSATIAPQDRGFHRLPLGGRGRYVQFKIGNITPGEEWVVNSWGCSFLTTGARR